MTEPRTPVASERRRAAAICTLCIATYFASYLIRKLLSIYNPQIVASGELSATDTAALAALYMLVYAIGQLFSGAVGDILHPKYMVSTGLLLAGAASVGFSLCQSTAVAYVLFALIGFGMSMMRGPIVRAISQSCQPSHARIGNVMLTCVGFVAPFAVGLVALFLNYRVAYGVIGGVCMAAAVLFFFGAVLLERRGVLRVERVHEGRRAFRLRELWHLDRLPLFLLLAMAVEIMSSSVEHWLTLYMTDSLAIDAGTAGMLLSVLLLVRAFATVLCLPLFSLFRQSDGWLLSASFAVAAVCFLCMWLSPYPYLSLVLLFLSQIACGVAMAVVWSIYLPSLADTGHVSGINGLLDAAGYASSAGMTVVFAAVVERFAFDGLLLFWCLFCMASVLLSLCAIRRKAAKKMEN